MDLSDWRSANVLTRLKQWWCRRRAKREKMRRDEWYGIDDDANLKEAVRYHAASTRLVRIKASQSARALGKLNRILAIRARALEGIQAAEDAIDAINRKHPDDK